MNAWFISDLHLKDISERSSQTLLRFLHSLIQDQRPATHLFLLGDIFDVWVGNHKEFITKWEPLLTALKTLSLKGVKIYYFEGNHDMHLGGHWKNTIGANVFDSPQIIQLGKWSVRMDHGDFINPEDKSYLRLRAFLRSWPVKLLVILLPGAFWMKFGDWWSTKSRKSSQVIRQDRLDKIRERIHAYARASRSKDKFDYIITGHVHLRDRYEFSEAGETVVSINLGSWFDKSCALRISESGDEMVLLT